MKNVIVYILYASINGYISIFYDNIFTIIIGILDAITIYVYKFTCNFNPTFH